MGACFPLLLAGRCACGPARREALPASRSKLVQFAECKALLLAGRRRGARRGGRAVRRAAGGARPVGILPAYRGSRVPADHQACPASCLLGCWSSPVCPIRFISPGSPTLRAVSYQNLCRCPSPEFPPVGVYDCCNVRGTAGLASARGCAGTSGGHLWQRSNAYIP